MTAAKVLNEVAFFVVVDDGVLAFEPREGGRFTETLPNGKVFEIIVIDADSGEEVLSTHRPTKEEAEKVKAQLEKAGAKVELK